MEKFIPGLHDQEDHQSNPQDEETKKLDDQTQEEVDLNDETGLGASVWKDINRQGNPLR